MCYVSGDGGAGYHRICSWLLCHFLYSPALPLPPSPLMAPQQRKPAEMAEEKKKALHQYNDDHGHFSLVR